MSTQSPPNYYAIDEAVAMEHGIRAACILLGAVVVGIILAARWVWHLAPVVGG